MRRISVTRRYIDFLYGDRIKRSNRSNPVEGSVMSDLERQFKDAIVGSWYANGRAKTVLHGADLAWEATKHLFAHKEERTMYGARRITDEDLTCLGLRPEDLLRCEKCEVLDTELQLPTTDDDHVGEETL